jgi:hypothetical protein
MTKPTLGNGRTRQQSIAVVLAGSLIAGAAGCGASTDWSGSPPSTVAHVGRAAKTAPPPAPSGDQPDRYVPNVGSGNAPGTTEPPPPTVAPTTTVPADDTGTLEPTPDSLRRAADRTDRRRFRYTVQLDVAGLAGNTDGSIDGALVHGSHDGEQTSLHLDVLAGVTGAVGVAELLDLLPPDVTDLATVDMVVDGDTLYVTSPLFSILDRNGARGVDGLTGIDGRWGRIDLAGLGVLTGFAGVLNGSRNFNPRVILDLLRRTDLATDLGVDTLDGVTVRGVAADVNVGDVLRSHGIPPSALGQAAALEEVTVRVEAWADEQGLIRTAKLYAGADTFMRQMHDAGLSDGDILDLGLEAGVVVRFTDYGASEIDVAVPTGAHDLMPAIDLLPRLPGSGG